MTANQQETGAQPPKDPTVAAAEREAAIAKAQKEKAEYEKAEAEARRDKLKAEFGPFGDQSKITAPTGDVTTDEAGFVEVQILGQEAAREVSQFLTNALWEHKSSIDTIVIYNSADMTAITSYASILEQLKEFNAEYDNKRRAANNALEDARAVLKKPDPDPQGAFVPPADIGATALLAAPGIATGVVKSVAEFVNLFRTSTEFKNKTVPITEDMIVSYLVKGLPETKNQTSNGRQNGQARELKKAFSVYYPAYFPPNILASGEGSELTSTLKTIRGNKLTAGDTISTIDQVLDQLAKAKKAASDESESKAKELADKTAKLGALPAHDPGRPKIEAEIKQIKADKTRLEARGPRFNREVSKLSDVKSKLQYINTVADQVITSLDTPDATTKLTPFSQLIRAERLASILKKDKTYILRLTVAANGTTKIKKNLFFDARVRHSAGATLVFQLFDKDGRIVAADSMKYYHPWKSADEVRSMVNGGNLP